MDIMYPLINITKSMYFFLQIKRTFLIIFKDMSVVPQVFDAIRNCNSSSEKSLDSYPKTLGKGKYTVTGIRDLTIGFDSTQKNNKPVLPVSLSNQFDVYVTNSLVCMHVSYDFLGMKMQCCNVFINLI